MPQFHVSTASRPLRGFCTLCGFLNRAVCQTKGRVSILAVFFLFTPVAAQPQSRPILLDGYFSDWATVQPAYEDPRGDNGGHAIDLGRIWAANDGDFLYLRIEVGTEINLQSDNDLTLYLDTDNRPNTGLKVAGIGAELRWDFGRREGSFFSRLGETPLTFAPIRLRTLPTVTSTDFEIAVGRHAVPDGYTRLFGGDTLRILLRDEVAGDADVAPGPGEFITYVLDSTAVPPPEAIPIEKSNRAAWRLLTYNVLQDGPFDPNRNPRFGRILRAVRPDIVCFQEMFGHSAADVLTWVQPVLPLTAGEQWHALKVDAGNVTLSRYPIISHWLILQGSRMTATLLDLPPDYGSELLLINAHLRCCEANEARQREADALAAFLRDVRDPNREPRLAENTPVVIAGDLNLVGFRQQLETILTGDIVDRAQFGTSPPADWDGSSLRALVSRQTERRMAYTWRNDNSTFSPGRLDYIIFTDSVLEAVRNFVLYTPEMSSQQLQASDLHADDVSMASDHLPQVADFVAVTGTRVGRSRDRQGPVRLVLDPCFPNPFNISTTISFALQQDASVDLAIFDLNGRRVTTLARGTLTAGRHRLVWNAEDRASGLYECRLKVGQTVGVRKIALVK